MAAYREALAADNQVCAEFQSKLDATADRGVFVDTPWIPGELKEIVNYALGCDCAPRGSRERLPPASDLRSRNQVVASTGQDDRPLVEPSR